LATECLKGGRGGRIADVAARNLGRNGKYRSHDVNVPERCGNSKFDPVPAAWSQVSHVRARPFERRICVPRVRTYVPGCGLEVLSGPVCGRDAVGCWCRQI